LKHPLYFGLGDYTNELSEIFNIPYIKCHIFLYKTPRFADPSGHAV